jgi:hypothetical protein
MLHKKEGGQQKQGIAYLDFIDFVDGSKTVTPSQPIIINTSKDAESAYTSITASAAQGRGETNLRCTANWIEGSETVSPSI